MSFLAIEQFEGERRGFLRVWSNNSAAHPSVNVSTDPMMSFVLRMPPEQAERVAQDLLAAVEHVREQQRRIERLAGGAP